MKIAIAQINTTVGDMHGNATKIIDFAKQAYANGASLLITPELALCGYPPEDLLYRDDFNDANQRALAYICQSVPNLSVLVGHPRLEHNQLFNAASLIQHGQVQATYHKHVLPNYSVFDEARYFEPGDQPLVFELNGIHFGVMICADGWEAGPAKKAKQADAEFLLSLNASPYHMEKLNTRHEVLAQRAKRK